MKTLHLILMVGSLNRMGKLKERYGAWTSLLWLFFTCRLQIEQTAGYFFENCTLGSFEKDINNVLCSEKGFYSVPAVIPQNVEFLDISSNFISELNMGDFKNLKSLKCLIAFNNKIQQIQNGAFKELIALRELNLAHNRLTTISNSTFQGLVNLTTIRLDSNLICEIKSFDFSFFSNLKTLNLSRNKLNNIEQVKRFIMLPDLEELYLGSNNFSSFTFCDISNTSLTIKLLDLSRNPLKIFQITADIFPHLETLDLSLSGPKGGLKWDVQDRSFLRNVNRLNLSGIHISEQEMTKIFYTFNSSLNSLRLNNLKGLNITTVLKAACQIPTLRVLNLRSNSLTPLDEKLFQPCSSLINLDVSYNSIQNISELTFKPLVQMATLQLQHNQLSTVPSAIRHLPYLSTLVLTFNNIAYLNCDDFVNLKRITNLFLTHNQISSLHSCVFQGLQSLKTLTLGSNQILSITDAFKGLQNLELLQLNGNNLKSIKGGVFKGLHSLTVLDMADNHISVIDKGGFVGLDTLTTLLLSSNKITQDTIHSKDVFSGLPNLSDLDLHSNSISFKNCDELKEPPFSLLKSLTYLSIHSQGSKGQAVLYLPSNLLQGLSSLHYIEVGNMHLEFLHPNTFTYTPNLSYLDISKNFFTTFSPDVFQSVTQLTTLVLSTNHLQSLDFLIHANLSRVRSLKVKTNQLAVINETLIHSLPALKYFSLVGNTFTCDCKNAWFIHWAENNNQTQVTGAGGLICNYPDDLRGTKLLHLDIDSCTIDVGLFYFISTTTLVLLTLLSSFFYHFLRYQLIYTYYLFLAFLYDYNQKETCRDLQYDAFISYNAQDEPWVLEKLLPELEDKQGWTLCLHHRDFQPGKPILDNIVDSIYSSRKTICLISRHYLESEWCSREIQVASFRLFDEKKDVLVLVFLEDIPPCHLSPYHRMRKLVKKHTYLRWPKPGEDTRIFWQKLKIALDTRKDCDQENPILSGMDY